VVAVVVVCERVARASASRHEGEENGILWRMCSGFSRSCALGGVHETSMECAVASATHDDAVAENGNPRLVSIMVTLRSRIKW
jgi:hypothetical protein